MIKRRVLVSLWVLLAFVTSFIGGIRPASAAPTASKKPVPPAPTEIKAKRGIVKVSKASTKDGIYVLDNSQIVKPMTAEDGQPVFLGYGSGQSQYNYCGTPWEVVLISEIVFGSPHHCFAKPKNMEILGYDNLDSNGHVNPYSSAIYVRNTDSGQMFKQQLIPCLYDPFGGCQNLWGAWVPWWEDYEIFSNPFEVTCPVGQEDTAPPDIPEDQLPPMPDPPTDRKPGIPSPAPGIPAPGPGLPFPSPDAQATLTASNAKSVEGMLTWVSSSAAQVRQAYVKAKAQTKAEGQYKSSESTQISPSSTPTDGGGGGSRSCFDGRQIVVNDEDFLLSHAYPITERDGKIYYPSSLEAMEHLGFAVMYRRERTWLGGGKRIIQIANGNTSIALWANSGWALWDLQKTDPVSTFRSEGDKEIYYFDLERVVKMAGGWVKRPGETADHRYHIFIPWNIRGTWLGSCEQRGYSVEAGNITECPNDTWMPGSTWDYVANRPGSDALDVIMVAQGLLNKHWVKDGQDPHDKSGMRTSISEDWGPIGLRHEGPTYNSFLYPLLPFLEQTAFASLDAVYVASQYKVANQAMHDPAKTAKLGEEALQAAKAEQLAFGAKIDQIKRYILEHGWNWIEIGGKRIYVPINVAPAEATPVQPGWNLRVYGVGPYGLGGWRNQSKIGGTPDPIVFSLDDNGSSKTYVAMFEWADEKGHFEDSQGEVTLQGWDGEKYVTVEVKAGYERFVDPATGDFTLDFLGFARRKWLRGFEESISNAKANGRGHMMVFTNKKVYDAFIKSVREEFGEEFYQKNAHRIVQTTKPVVRPSDPGSIPPPSPCGMRPDGVTIMRPCP